MNKLFLWLGVFALNLSCGVAVVPCLEDQTAEDLHRWAVQSHREFLTKVGEIAGLKAGDNKHFQYVVGPTSKDLNFAYLGEGCSNDLSVLGKFMAKGPVIYVEGKDDQRVKRYAKKYKILATELTQAYDLKEKKRIPKVPSHIKVKKLTSQKELEKWISVLSDHERAKLQLHKSLFLKCDVMDTDSPFEFYMAYLGGKPVGTGMLYKTKDFAGMYNVSVLPEARNQRVGTAIVATLTKSAKAQNYRWMVLQAEAMGVSMYHRFGYKDVGSLVLFDGGEPL